MAAAASAGPAPAFPSLLDLGSQDVRLFQARTSKNPSPEEQTDNALRDNFPGWDARDLFCKLIDGKTLYQTVLDGKEANKAKKGSLTMGMLFYDKLRQKFASSQNISALLKPDDPNAPIRPKLFAAMKRQ